MEHEVADKLDGDIQRIVFWLVARIHKTNRRVPLDDLVQEGMLEAMKAIKSYDASRGAKLDTWVVNIVNNRLKVLCRRRKSDGQLSIDKIGDVEEKKDDSEALSCMVFRDNLEVLHKRLSPLAWGYVCESLLSGRRRKTITQIAKKFGVSKQVVIDGRREARIELLELLGRTEKPCKEG
jgi:RNA polymerase sigma factor (sigma-70 family)